MSELTPAGPDSPDGSGPAVRLREPENRVSPRAIWWWSIQGASGWLVLVVAQLVVWLMVPAVAAWMGYTLLASVVLGLAYTVLMPQWRYRVHRWETTAAAVYTQAGWVNLEWRVAPISRIQTVDTERGPLQQLLGLSTVTVTTASAAGPVAIAGLEHARAVRVVDELTAAAEQVRGDAT